MSLLDNFSNDELRKELAERGIPDAAVFMADRDAAIAERDAAVRERDLVRVDLSDAARAFTAKLDVAIAQRDEAQADRDAFLERQRRAIDMARAQGRLDFENVLTGNGAHVPKTEGDALKAQLAESEAREVALMAALTKMAKCWTGNSFTTRLPCKGRQKLWALPADVERGVLEQLAA